MTTKDETTISGRPYYEYDPIKAKHDLDLSHAYFQQVSASMVRVDKDVFQHFSVGSLISWYMLDAYKEKVGTSARITVNLFPTKES